WAVVLDITVGQQQGTRAARILGNKQLCYRASAVVRDYVHLLYCEPIEESGDHVGLRRGCDTLSRSDLGATQTHPIWGQAPAIVRQAIDATAPLEAAEWEAV